MPSTETTEAYQDSTSTHALYYTNQDISVQLHDSRIRLKLNNNKAQGHSDLDPLGRAHERS